MMLRFVIPLVALGGCAKAQGETAQTSKPKPISVETVVIAEREVPNTLLLAGTLKANQESDLAANASASADRLRGRNDDASNHTPLVGSIPE